MSQDLTKQKGQTPQQILMTTYKAELGRIVPYLEKLLPHEGQVVKFVQMAMVAIMRDPKILECSKNSFLLAVLWCAQKDLEPGVEDGAWLIPYQKKVVPIAAYKGLIKKASETESVKDVQPHGIFKNDTFEYSLGLDPSLTHQPAKLGMDRGDLIGVYVVVTMPDGSKRFHVMDRAEVEKIRASSAAWKAGASGPWKDWEEAMFKKTAIKQIMKYIPVKPAFRDLVADDNRLETGATVAALLNESGAELPEGLGEEDQTGAGMAPPEPDTTEFDRLVEAQGPDEMRLSHVNAFINAIVIANKKKKITAAQVKADAATKFAPWENDKQEPQPGFWNAFLQWEAKTYPALAAATTVAAASPARPAAAAPPAGGPPAAAADDNPFPVIDPGPGEPPPSATPGPDPDFAARRLVVWNDVVDKRIPYTDLLQAVGVAKLEDITPENIASVKAFVEKYKAPTRRGKK